MARVNGVDDGDPVPRLPRGRGLKLSTPQLIRIGMVFLLLVALLLTYRQCADAVSTFVTSFGPDETERKQSPAQGELIPTNATPEQVKEIVDRERAKKAPQAPVTQP
jgi:hypothetical protein